VTLDLVVVGCGAVVEGVYRSALKRLESRGIARVAALVDPNPARTSALKRHFRSADTYATGAEAFARMTPDLTIVASPPGLHAEHVVEALGVGSHVLCEKPMAVSVADAERMVAAARVAHRVLAVGMARRMYPCLAEARALLAGGALGDDLRFVYREGNVYDWPISTDTAFRRATAGGGVLTDLGSHVIDFLAALFGTPTATAYADDGHADGVESNCRIDLAFPGGRGEAQLSWSQPLVTGLHVIGSAGELTMMQPGRLDLVRWRRHGEPWDTRVSTSTWPDDLRPGGRRGTPRTHYDCMYHQLVQVLRAVIHGEPVPVDGEQALTVVRAIDACYRQATPLRLPWLTAAEQAQTDARHWRRDRWAA
jgi:predicted dehydrogenase